MNLFKSVSTVGVSALVVMLTPIAGAMAGDPVVVELPEPSMVGLLAIGVIGVIAIARMRK